MRNIIITEGQLKRLLGEDFDTYLPDSGEENKQSDISYGTETNTKDADVEGNRYNEPITAKFGKEKAPGYQPWRGRISGSLYEENSQLKTTFKKNGQSVPTGTINYWKNQLRNGGNISKAQISMIKDVDNERKGIKSHKTLMKNMGAENQFQKAGGSKESGNGMAHTKKNNGVSITFEK